MTRYGLDAPARWLWAATALSVVLLGEGGPGLTLLPGLCLWLALSGLRLRHTTPIHGTLIMAAAAALLTGMGLYFVGYNRGTSVGTRSPVEAALFALHMATAPGGSTMTDVWPWSGAAVVIVLAATVGVLALGWSAASSSAETRGPSRRSGMFRGRLDHPSCGGRPGPGIHRLGARGRASLFGAHPAARMLGVVGMGSASDSL